MEKVNVSEILRNCPQGMELYSPLCGDCKLYSVNDYNITIEIPNRDSLIILRHDGTYCGGNNYKRDKVKTLITVMMQILLLLIFCLMRIDTFIGIVL